MDRKSPSREHHSGKFKKALFLMSMVDFSILFWLPQNWILKKNVNKVSSQGVLTNSVVVVQSKNIPYCQIRNWWSIQMHKNPLMIKANSIQFDFFFPKWASTLNFRLKYLIWQGDSSIKMSFVHELYFFLFFMTFMFAKYKWPCMY